MTQTLKQSDQSWSIIVFGYNEAGSVAKTMHQAATTLGRLVGDGPWEIVMVDDGSKDGTYEAAKNAAASIPKALVIRHPVNKGIGEALLTGYGAVQYENVVAIPADGQFNTEELLPFGHVPPGEFIVFTRIQQTGYTAFRRFLSSANKQVNAALLGLRLRDVNWVKIYKRSELRQLGLEVRSSIVESEICAKLMVRGNRAVEVPSVYHERTVGVSKAASLKFVRKTIAEIWHLMLAVFRYRIAHMRGSQHSLTRG